MNFQEQLRALNVHPSFVETTENKTLEEFWTTCRMVDSLLYLADKTVNKKLVVFCACKFAREVVHLNNDPVVIGAIETAERWIRGEANVEELNAAVRASFDAASVAPLTASAAAARSAYSAVSCIIVDRNSKILNSTDFAIWAATAAANAVAPISCSDKQLSIIRETISLELVREGLEKAICDILKR